MLLDEELLDLLEELLELREDDDELEVISAVLLDELDDELEEVIAFVLELVELVLELLVNRAVLLDELEEEELRELLLDEDELLLMDNVTDDDDEEDEVTDEEDEEDDSSTISLADTPVTEDIPDGRDTIIIKGSSDIAVSVSTKVPVEYPWLTTTPPTDMDDDDRPDALENEYCTLYALPAEMGIC
jgi:hypothetical protein